MHVPHVQIRTCWNSPALQSIYKEDLNPTLGLPLSTSGLVHINIIHVCLTWNICCLDDLEDTGEVGDPPLMAVFLNIVIRGLGSVSAVSLSSSDSSFSLASAILLRASSLHNHITSLSVKMQTDLFIVSPPAAPTVLARCLVGEPPLLTEHSYWPGVSSWKM